jgi:hypothetical protein
MSRKHVPIAIAYDFDGTLAPGNMQEHQFLPDIGMTPTEFWTEVKTLTKKHQADEVLIYMNLMLEKARGKHAPVRRDDFKARGKHIELFEGVDTWFDGINAYARSKSVAVQHYLLSSGNEEILAGTPIASEFTKIYASKFFFDENGVAIWPALAVNYTTKTQYLFRINKDAHDLSDNSKVNQFVEKRNRVVPFENMVYIGDGATDIPCFRLMKEQGGLSLAVYAPKKKGAKAKADKYLKDGRVHAVVAAVYSQGGELYHMIRAFIDTVAARADLAAVLGDYR